MDGVPSHVRRMLRRSWRASQQTMRIAYASSDSAAAITEFSGSLN
jgi:hypothetical protein